MIPHEIKLDYKPFKKQKEFHASSADELLYGGCTGGGKSVALLMEAWQRSVETPGHKSLILRRTYKQLQLSLLNHMREFFPKDFGHFVKTEMTYYFPNGSIINFGYIDSDQDKYIYQGTEYDMVGWEELTQFTFDMYIYLFSRIRSAKNPDNQPVIRATSNPGNIGHNFVKQRFIDPAPEGKIWTPNNDTNLTRQYIKSTIFDNKPLMENDPHYIDRLKEMPEDLQKAYLYGDWDVFGGMVFKEFKRDVHVIKPFKIPMGWQKYMSIDWGFSYDPFAILWGTVVGKDTKIGDRTIKKGSIVIYREYYGSDETNLGKGIEMTGIEVANEVIDRENELVHVRIADHDMFAKRGHSAPTIAEDFGDKGLYLQKAEKGSGSRIQGKNEVHKRLRQDEDNEPSLYIFENCVHLIRTLPTLPYSNKRPEDVDTDAEDHLYDSLRYLLMARPIHKEKKKKKKKKKTTNSYTGY